MVSRETADFAALLGQIFYADGDLIGLEHPSRH
jgi:hypothetical protein